MSRQKRTFSTGGQYYSEDPCSNPADVNENKRRSLIGIFFKGRACNAYPGGHQSRSRRTQSHKNSREELYTNTKLCYLIGQNSSRDLQNPIIELHFSDGILGSTDNIGRKSQFMSRSQVHLHQKWYSSWHAWRRPWWWCRYSLFIIISSSRRRRNTSFTFTEFYKLSPSHLGNILCKDSLMSWTREY